jgi:hypothetical protein
MGQPAPIKQDGSKLTVAVPAAEVCTIQLDQ